MLKRKTKINRKSKAKFSNTDGTASLFLKSTSCDDDGSPLTNDTSYHFKEEKYFFADKKFVDPRKKSAKTNIKKITGIER